MIQEIFFNAFTRVTLNDISLREMQVANPKVIYSLTDSDRLNPEIDMLVRAMLDTAFVESLFNSPETGYFQKESGFYYRNCNVVNDMNWPDVFYRGRLLPHSLLRIRFQEFCPLKIDVQVTSNYLRESRSRLTRIPSIDETINNVLLIGAIMRGFLPMHAAAIEVGTGKTRCSLLFMGLPNTGKTQTSVSARRALSGVYLAEDICFAHTKTSEIFGGPYTLDETKIQNYDELRATKYVGARLGAIIMLKRTVEMEQLRNICAGAPEIAEFIIEMNRYEFEWNYDLLVRHLLIGGANHGISSRIVSCNYEQGIGRLAAKVGAFELSGHDPKRWTRLLVDGICDAGLAERAFADVK